MSTVKLGVKNPYRMFKLIPNRLFLGAAKRQYLDYAREMAEDHAESSKEADQALEYYRDIEKQVRECKTLRAFADFIKEEENLQEDEVWEEILDYALREEKESGDENSASG